MKRTSYIIIGLIVAVLVGIVVISHFRMRNFSEKEMSISSYRMPLDIDLEIDGVIDEIEFTSRNSIYQDLIYHNFIIELNDSIENPYLTIDSLFRNYIDVSVLDHRLKLEMLSEPVNGENEKTEMMLNMYIDYKNTVTLFLPHKPLKSVSSDAPMTIRNLDADKVVMYTEDYLKLVNCRVDSLKLTAAGVAKLNFKDSSIEYMRLRMKSNFLKINCSDSTSLIRKLDFMPLGKVKTDLFLNEANIDTLRWAQPESAQLTVRMRHPINIVK